jgi:hypothetical protein
MERVINVLQESSNFNMKIKKASFPEIPVTTYMTKVSESG